MSEWTVAGYTEIRELGRGGAGRVVLARHDETGAPVAVKYLLPAGEDEPARRAFRAEARLLAEVDDPHVVRLLEYVETGDGAAIVMELVEGVSLRAMLREHGPTEPEAALVVLKGSLLGLAAAHAHGVVHRDYKPENVLVDTAGHSKLTDFGISVHAGRQGQLAGTPAYMAPEQWQQGPATVRTDIYAATVTFYECLVGSKPYVAEDPMALGLQHAEAPIPVENVPANLRDLVRRGMAKDPAQRPADARKLVAELTAAAGGYGPDWEEKGRSQLARRVALLALLLPGAAGLVGGSAIGTTLLGPLRWSRRVLIGIGAGLLIGGGIGTAIAIGASGPGPVAAPTPTLSVPANPAPSTDPAPSLPPTPTASPQPSPSPTPSDPPPSQPPPTQPSPGIPPPPPPSTTLPPPTSPPPPPLQVTLLQIPSIQIVDPCSPGATSCPGVVVNVAVHTNGTGPVNLTVSVAGSGGGSQTYSTTLSGSTSYELAVPPNGQVYPMAQFCPTLRHTIVVTAETSPSATATASRSCNSPTR